MSRETNEILPNKLKFVNFNSQMEAKFKRFSINSPRWKNAILTGKFHLIRTYLLNFLSNYIKMALFKSCRKTGLSDCAKIISVEQILLA